MRDLGGNVVNSVNLTFTFILGDKANHVPVLHVPQLYYFVAFAMLMGWPAVVFGRDGPVKLGKEVLRRMFGTRGSVCLDKRIIWREAADRLDIGELR